MRRAIIALLLCCGLVLPAAAFDDPKALLEAVYAGYTAGGNRTEPDTYFSARLKGLYAANVERQALDAEQGIAVDPNAPPVLEFDPFIEGSHALISEVQIGQPVVTGGRAVATVSFANFDHRATLAISLVREGDGWKVDDIASLSGENWLLSWLLQYDPFGGM